MELSFIKYLPIFFICIVQTNSKDFNGLRFSGPSENMVYPTVSTCYNKFVGSKGTIHSPALPRAYQYSVDCLWDIDVTDSYNIEFEFEIFRLPKTGEHKCESYVELSYVKNQNGMTKRLFCPNDLVNKIYIDSNTVHLRFHSGKYKEEYGKDSYGFKINYNAIPVDKPNANHAATIVLVSFSTLFIITVCVICIRSHRKSPRIGQIPSHVIIPAAPNAPTRADLQSAFDFHLRELTQAPQNGSRYLSRISHDVSDFADRRDASNPPQKADDRRASEVFIATTPRSIFPVSRRVLSADSAKRIADLRTRLVARFPSLSSNESSERSVFLSTSSQMNYSQLNSEEEQETAPEERPQKEQRRSVSCGGKNIPSIVIELYE